VSRVGSTLTLQVPVSDELSAEAGGLTALLASLTGYVVSTPPYPAQAEAGPWRAELVFHELYNGASVTGPAYSKVEAAWTDVPPERWESLACTWVHMRLRVLAPGESAVDTHQPPSECGTQEWAWYDEERIILYGTCRKAKGHASRWHADWERDTGRLLAEWSGPREHYAPAGAPLWEPEPEEVSE
jgi:hypothetical protein